MIVNQAFKLVTVFNCSENKVVFDLPFNGRMQHYEVPSGEEAQVPEEWTLPLLCQDRTKTRPSGLQQYAPQLCVCTKEDAAKIKAHKAWLKAEAERTKPEKRIV